MRITITRKLFAIIAALITFMSGALFMLAHNELEGLFQSYASEAMQRNAVQWADLVSYFYDTDGHSWSKVGMDINHVMSHTSSRSDLPQQLVVVDNQNHVEFEVGTKSGSPNKRMDNSVPVLNHGQKIATMLIYGEGLERLYDIEEAVLHTMTLALMWGVIIAAALALLSGAFMARRMTRPLKHILKAIRSIIHGDLKTQIPVTSTDEFGQVALAFNQMTAKLAATEEARRHLVADVAHELRIPLTIMQGQLELIQQGVKTARPQDLLPIHDEVIRLTRLVQDLHQLSLAEVGKLQLRKRPTDMVQFLRRIVDNFEVEAFDHNIALTLSVSDDMNATIHVDPDRMTQVFVNLLGNALRYTPAGGTVHVEISRESQALVVALSDTGPGIEADHLPFVFDRFYRGEEDRSRDTGGTGLGLAIAKEFVEAHNGTIRVASVKGVGTTFVVRLPLSV
ncbi:ATP-binding protein [Alicyclobacillus fastidiosus]|uniref:histidine kinase n=1 Tax=Alicyclobacillus fastidiosus TaxID=392011 RepID=A0ABY6ZML9_9BACL|nr:ATP-binding protein [Alicyclobacillus fastidiosus]WAH44183.1 ATP-binding protein [Alicyclobacillus fastidiosus]GMA60497.1 two-component sensor histidine kinase [Alicyclobacillus fastidiosus]